jgi:NAD+ synthetase
MTTSNYNHIDYDNVLSTIDTFIKNKVGNRPVVIGLSGGIDSTITCALAIRALGPDQVKGILINNVRYGDDLLNETRKMASDFGITLKEFNSDNVRKELIDSLNIPKDDVVKVSTLDARITDTVIRTYAMANGSIYLGTINGTERLTGWYPKGALYGDYCPIGDLLKGQVQELGRIMKLPKKIVTSVSHDAAKICSGCGELPAFKGIPYDTLDQILYIMETTDPSDVILTLKESGIKTEHFLPVIIQVQSARHKTSIFPPYPEINYWHKEEF